VKSAQLFVAVAGILTFALLGAIQSLYGPLLPGLKQAFALDTAAVGLVFSAHGLGALAGILVPSLLRVPILSSHWLGAASALLVLGATGLAIAPTWPAVLVAAFVMAMGFGIHVVRLNGLFVAGFGSSSMRMSQLINAAFSIGSILGPVGLGLSGEPSKRAFGVVAILAFALLPISVLTDRSARTISAAAPSHESQAGGRAASRSGSRALLAAFAAFTGLAVGVENSIAGWMTTVALADGYAFSSAANLTALFFGAIFAGRLLAAGFGDRVRAASLVIAAIGSIVVLLSIATLTHTGPIAFALAGFAIAPIFSATLVWLGSALPTSPHANTLVIAGALLGSAVLPSLVGRAVGQFGAAAASPAILCIALGALAVAIGVHLAHGR
jgi:FHS family glucose/mannose:H+ symporter-like MFS transporter